MKDYLKEAYEAERKFVETHDIKDLVAKPGKYWPKDGVIRESGPREFEYESPLEKCVIELIIEKGGFDDLNKMSKLPKIVKEIACDFKANEYKISYNKVMQAYHSSLIRTRMWLKRYEGHLSPELKVFYEKLKNISKNCSAADARF